MKNSGIEILLSDLTNLKQYLSGAYHISDNENFISVLARACIIIDDIMYNIRKWDSYKPEIKVNND